MAMPDSACPGSGKTNIIEKLLPSFHGYDPTNASLCRLARMSCDPCGNACADGFHRLVLGWIGHHGRALSGHGSNAGQGPGPERFRRLGSGRGKSGVQVLSVLPSLWRACRTASFRTVQVVRRRTHVAVDFPFEFFIPRTVRMGCGAATRSSCLLLTF